jgi:hypothetical protein
MRWFGRILVAGATLWLAGTVAAAPIKIIKVLPQYLDAEGRHSLSPSLYDRDAYQDGLRKSPDRQAGMRFAVQWKVPRAERDSLQLRLELRGSKAYGTTPMILVQPLKRTGWPECWTQIGVDKEAFQKLGNVIAWRVTLCRGNQVLAEQKSFLW